MQIHVHGTIAVVHMADLSPARGVYGVSREDCEAFLLKAGGADEEGRGVAFGEVGEGSAESEVHFRTAGLV